MDLSDVLRALRRQWLAAVAIFVLCVAYGVYQAYAPDERFTTRSTILVQPDPESTIQNPQTLLGFMVPSLSAQVETRSFRQKVRERVDDDLPGSFRIRTVGDPTTGILFIEINAPSGQLAATWANAYAETLVEAPPENVTGFVTVQVLDPALAPNRPSSPVRPPLIVGSVALGLVLGLFGALGVNAVRNRANRAEEIRRRFGTSVLGEIPPIRRKHANRPLQLLSGGGPPGVIEAFQTLRANLEILMATAKPQAIAITSTALGEGKSTVTTSLGWALAAVGHKVILVDADLRRPALHTYLEKPFGHGVASAHVTDPAKLVQPVPEVPGLSLVPAGVPDRHPAELMSTNLPLVLDRLCAPDRLVLIDSPPINAAAETAIIAATVRNVILVVDAGRNDPSEIERTLGYLAEKNARVLGVVINRARTGGDPESMSYYHVPTRPLSPGGAEAGAAAGN